MNEWKQFKPYSSRWAFGNQYLYTHVTLYSRTCVVVSASSMLYHRKCGILMSNWRPNFLRPCYSEAIGNAAASQPTNTDCLLNSWVSVNFFYNILVLWSFPATDVSVRNKLRGLLLVLIKDVHFIITSHFYLSFSVFINSIFTLTLNYVACNVFPILL